LNISFISENLNNFDIEPKNILITYDDFENGKTYENMTIFGRKFGTSKLHLNIQSDDDINGLNVTDKTISINVVRTEKELFDSLLIAFTVFFLFAIGLGLPLSKIPNNKIFYI